MVVGDDKSDSYFFDVLNTSPNVKTKEQTIPNGDTWHISEIHIGASGSSACHVSLVWDYGGTEEILFSTGIPTNVHLNKDLVGDGTKKLAIVLTNNCTATKRMGMIYVAEEV